MRRRLFRDAKGRKWKLQLCDSDALQRLDKAWPEWRLEWRALLEDPEQISDFERLAHFVAVLHDLLRPQIDRRELNPKQFGESFTQDTWIKARKQLAASVMDLELWARKNPQAWLKMNEHLLHRRANTLEN